MPSVRRVRLLALGAFLSIIFVIFYLSHSESGSSTHTADFYERTASALKSRPPGAGAGGGGGKDQAAPDAQAGRTVAGHTPSAKGTDDSVDEDDDALTRETSSRPKAAAQQAKQLTNMKSPLKPDAPSAVIGVGNSASGQDVRGGTVKPVVDKEVDQLRLPADTVELEHRARMEMSLTLRKAPVVIFSKTTNAASTQVKDILLEKYVIEPAPWVIELDKHELGHEIHEILALQTGRKTLPSVFVNSVSVGGVDDVADLDATKRLIRRLENLGSGRVHVRERLASGSP